MIRYKIHTLHNTQEMLTECSTIVVTVELMNKPYITYLRKLFNTKR